MAMVSYEPLTNFTYVAEHAETWVEKQTRPRELKDWID